MRLNSTSASKLALTCLSVGLLTTLTACGGGDSSASKVATLGTGGDGANQPTDTTAVDTQDQWLKFAQCMRDNGVDMKDPTFDANGNLQSGFGPDSGIDMRAEATRTAMEACSDQMPARGPGGGGGPQFDVTKIQDAMNSFTSCLRDQGQDVDDIDFTAGPGGGGQGGPGGGPPNSGDVAVGGDVPPGGFQGAPPSGGQDGNGGANGAGFDPTARIIEQLGLDSTDPKVAAAVDACSSTLDGAFPTAGGNNGSSNTGSNTSGDTTDTETSP
jgi:hypothetical protein